MPKIRGFENPFRPGAGHMPPYLAGRTIEQQEFRKYLEQRTILQNLIITGLRGVGKTVLLHTLKPIAQQEKWLWVGTDLSETTSLSESNMATRLLTDLSVITSSAVIQEQELKEIGFNRSPHIADIVPYSGTSQTMISRTMNFDVLQAIYSAAPGLVSDKLKRVLEDVALVLLKGDWRGIIFAYDEAQNLSDHSAKEQYPLSLLLEVFQYIQSRNIPFMLVFTGLPTLLGKLVDARTYSERMFHIIELKKLSDAESRQAIQRPINEKGCPVTFNEQSVDLIARTSGGYPYFLQYICREVYDIFVQQNTTGKTMSVPMKEIVQKLDTDFFAGRWAKATDRQRDLLAIIATLDNCDDEFTVLEIVEASKGLPKRFTPSHANQLLSYLTAAGLIYKNRYGKYCFAVPLLGEFIKRQGMIQRQTPTQ
jgi:hypothetical protein